MKLQFSKPTTATGICGKPTVSALSVLSYDRVPQPTISIGSYDMNGQQKKGAIHIPINDIPQVIELLQSMYNNSVKS
jgi:hypothetical protein